VVAPAGEPGGGQVTYELLCRRHWQAGDTGATATDGARRPTAAGGDADR
jgi:hypothetical protein